MKLTILGSGTSQGVPVIGCRCEVCTSTDSRDKRLRTSAMIETDGGARFVIDAGPDFRCQMLRAGVSRLDAILLTHEHKDHTGGIDDVRAFNFVDYPPVIHPVDIYAGTYEDLADAYLVIVPAGANQLPGESRINLTEKNVRIFQSIIPESVRYNTECLLLIVANPVDILTTVALRLSGFPPERVIGSGTVLDSSRFKYRLGEYIGIDHRNVHAFIIGEHGDSEVAVWSSATVSGIAVRDFCDELGIVFTREQMDEIVRDVKNSAYEIIEKKGATFYAVALAIRRIAEALIRDEHSLLTVSGYCSGAYEIEDVCIGLPMILGRDGIENIVEIPLNQLEKDNLHESADALKKVLTDMGIN